MRNELKRHKKSDKIKWAITGIAFVLVFVFLAGLCMQLFGQGKVKPSEWFKKTECVHIDEDNDGKCDECGKDMPEDKDGEEKQDESSLVVTSTSSKAMKLAVRPLSATDDDDNLIAPDIATYANTDMYSVTATVDPVGSTAVNFSLTWANPSSSWAKGKSLSAFLTVTPDEDDGLTAILTCKKPFGEQAILTAVAVSNTSIRATATVDYKEKHDITYNIPGQLNLSGDTSEVKTWTFLPYKGAVSYSVGREYENHDDVTGEWVPQFMKPVASTQSCFGHTSSEAYTISSGYEFDYKYHWEVSLSDELIALAQSSGVTFPCTSMDAFFADYSDYGGYQYALSQVTLFGYSERNHIPNEYAVFQGFLEGQDDGYSTLTFYPYTTLIELLKGCDVDLIITLYNGDYSTTYQVNIADSSLRLEVSNLSVSDTAIEF